MILVCPHCKTGFQIPDDAVGPHGRRVRCGACAHVWHAGGEAAAPPDERLEPEVPAREPEPEPEAGPDSPEISADAYRDDPLPRLGGPAYGAAALPALTRGRHPWIALGWAVWVVFVVAIGIAVFGFRAQMLATWPPIVGFYELLGIDQTAPPPVLRARDVLSVRIDPDSVWEASGESWALTVSGTIISRADIEMALPPLILHLVGEREQTLRRVRIEPAVPAIAARGSLRFEIRVPDAPAETAGIVHVWEQGD